MIRPPGFRGAAFTAAADGDPFADSSARRQIAGALGIADDWALVHQVHGGVAEVVETPGVAGDADALVTMTPGLPLAVKTADCLPVIIEAERAVAVVHAGWRGLAAGVLRTATRQLAELGQEADRAALGPAIGPCCYEVGDEVAAALGNEAETTWGTRSVNLLAAAGEQLEGVDLWISGDCTRCGDGYESYRRDATSQRQGGIGWIP